MTRPSRQRHVAFDWIDAAGLVLALFVVALVHILVVGGPAEWPTRLAAMVSVVGAHRLRRALFGAPMKFVDRRLSACGLLATALIIFGTLLAAGGLSLAAFWKPATPNTPVESVEMRPTNSDLVRASDAERLQERYASRIQIFLEIAAAGLAMLIVGGLLDSRRTKRPD